MNRKFPIITGLKATWHPSDGLFPNCIDKCYSRMFHLCPERGYKPGLHAPLDQIKRWHRKTAEARALIAHIKAMESGKSLSWTETDGSYPKDFEKACGRLVHLAAKLEDPYGQFEFRKLLDHITSIAPEE